MILQLFLTFLKIGAFTFGGGYAMIPLIQREIVENKGWLSNDDIADIIAIAETTPGPIAINAATFVGYKSKGIRGALAATLGVVLPSFFIIVLISLLFGKYMKYEVVEHAFFGIRIAVIALMVKALFSMLKQCKKEILSYCVAIAAFISVGVFNINALIVISIAAVIGIIFRQIRVGKKV